MKWLLALLMILLGSSHGKQPEEFFNFFIVVQKLDQMYFMVILRYIYRQYLTHKAFKVRLSGQAKCVGGGGVLEC